MTEEKAYAHFDTSRFPLVLITFTGNQPTEKNFTAYLDQNLHLYNAAEELALVFDARQAVLPSYKFQKMQAEWLKEHEGLMKKYCRGTAYVIPNLLVRGILKAIFAIQKQPSPYMVSSTLPEAETWALEQLDTSP